MSEINLLSDEESFVLKESLLQSSGLTRSNYAADSSRGGVSPNKLVPACQDAEADSCHCGRNICDLLPCFPSPVHSIIPAIKKWTTRRSSTKLESWAIPPLPVKERAFLQQQVCQQARAAPQRRFSPCQLTLCSPSAQPRKSTVKILLESLLQSSGLTRSNYAADSSRGGVSPNKLVPACQDAEADSCHCGRNIRDLLPCFPSPVHSIIPAIKKWTTRRSSTKLESRAIPPLPVKERAFLQQQVCQQARAAPQRRFSPCQLTLCSPSAQPRKSTVKILLVFCP
ncbi:hypothetical protein DPX16_21640 [Anabarilius grahami]|uniref:Uncharacterized protein n=1 Tax=Anabarilius grahami TaxID=495550 RepID=A0A3N0YJP7_ANAGA|nr:hypothetical protein DPX16_21640 [Anabarilius grahami]